MNITGELVEEFRGLAKEYDGTSDPQRRIDLGAKIDELGGRLSEKQIPQFIKMVTRR